MKFIRDIIAEKTNTSAPDGDFATRDAADDPGIPAAEMVLPNNGDRVRSEIPGRRLQNRAALGAFGNVAGRDAPDDQPVAVERNVFADEMADDPAPQYQPEPDQPPAPEPCDLFADIWEDDSAIEPASDAFAEPETGADFDNPFFEASKDREDPSPFDQVETPPAPSGSAFQRFRRKQPASAPDPQSGEPEAPPTIEPAPEPVTPVQVPAPAAGRSRRQAGRVKTRLLGFGNEQHDGDLFANGTNAGPAAQAMFPVGWMVVVAGPGCGTAFALQNGVSQIGRGEGQAVRLDYGDTSISRENHAAVAYDSEQREFFLGHGGKANLVRLNGKPVLSTEPLTHGALIRIGETTLRFVGFCGSEFDWDTEQTGEVENARFD